MKLKKNIPILTRLISHLTQIEVKKLNSKLSPNLKLEYQFGKLILNSGNVNYSHGNLKTCFLSAFNKTGLSGFDVKSVLLLGLGLGSVIELLEDNLGSEIVIDAVEKDECLIATFNDLYDFDKTKLRLKQVDVVDHLLKEKVYQDLIIVDIFIEQDIPNSLLESKVLKRLFNSDFKFLYFNIIVYNEKSEANFNRIKKTLEECALSYEVLSPLAQNKILFVQKAATS